jgi:hypothetical protein
MPSYLLPALLTKKITFKRLTNKHVKGYEIYGLFADPNYSSGIREELLDYIINPSEPNVEKTVIELEYNDNATWQLPKDLYTDRDHKFQFFINDFILSTLYFQYNKYNRLLTIDTNLKPITINDTFRLEYYRDMITKTYPLEQDCSIKIKPIFTDTYAYGTHNIII